MNLRIIYLSDMRIELFVYSISTSNRKRTCAGGAFPSGFPVFPWKTLREQRATWQECGVEVAFLRHDRLAIAITVGEESRADWKGLACERREPAWEVGYLTDNTHVVSCSSQEFSHRRNARNEVPASCRNRKTVRRQSGRKGRRERDREKERVRRERKKQQLRRWC